MGGREERAVRNTYDSLETHTGEHMAPDRSILPIRLSDSFGIRAEPVGQLRWDHGGSLSGRGRWDTKVWTIS